MQYTYHINLDERGSFEADVRNAFDKTVFEISGGDIFEDGFMKNKHDMRGLQEYLQQMGVLRPTDTLKSIEQLTNEVSGKTYRNQLLSQLTGSKMATGGAFSLEYLQDPEYIELDKQYKALLEQNKTLDRYSRKLNTNQILLERIQRKKMRIALGEGFTPSQVVPIANLHYKRRWSLARMGKGGSLADKVEAMLEEYEPQFQYKEKSDVDRDSNPPAGEKSWFVYISASADIIDKIEHDAQYRGAQIEHFKNFAKSKGKKFDTLMYDVTTTAEKNPKIVFDVTDSFAF